LDNTGGGVPPGPERAALEDYLRKRGVENIKELFASKTTSLVRIAARIPAGARKGDPVDITVSAPDTSRTTSLRGGVLEECLLYNYDNTRNLSAAVAAATGREASNHPDAMLRGHALVKAEGPVVAGVAGDLEDADPSQKRGVVWGGGRFAGPDRPFILQINPEQQYARVAARIAERINETFHGAGGGGAETDVAIARSKTVVTLTVPGAYRLNMARFLRVVRLVPLTEAPPADGGYAQKLSKQMLDPATTITAALRLEALGAQSIPALKVGLHSDVPLVRFAAAEALAYLGSPSCGEELGRQVAEQPFVQAFALTALASLNEAVCRVKLEELLTAPGPETRYGAFRALRARDDHDPLVAGEKLGSFWLHEVGKGSAPQVHYSTAKRPEIVLFGDAPKFVAPLSILAGPEFTVRADEGKATCTVCRFTTRHGKQSKECPLEVAAVIRAVAELGGTYADAVEVLRQAEACRGLNCAVKADALPKAPSVYDLARAGVQFTGSGKDDVAAVQVEIGVTPTLYEKPSSKAE
ncbi:MAG TPA: flagellar basal body P-ring protein FlgI, partial [Gemmataceae bacterium]